MENNDILIIKNYQTDETIKKMYEEAFDKSGDDIKILKLSGGLKNAVYLINDCGYKTVLKIGPKDETKMVTLDRNTMWWEAKMLKLMENVEIPAPKLLYFDSSCKICSAPYIFMSYISGFNYLEHKKQITDEELSHIEYDLGLFSSKICSIKSESFFLPCQPNKKFNDNYEFTMNLFELLLNDASLKKINIGDNSYKSISDTISSKGSSLNSISNICLSHTDMWDGNILIKNGEVRGILDFSDLYYCDELMTFYFHTLDEKTSKEFLKGFNNKVLNHDELLRIEIYRLFTLLKMIVDVEFKEYGRYDWMYEKFNNVIKKVRSL